MMIKMMIKMTIIITIVPAAIMIIDSNYFHMSFKLGKSSATNYQGDINFRKEVSNNSHSAGKIWK